MKQRIHISRVDSHFVEAKVDEHSVRYNTQGGWSCSCDCEHIAMIRELTGDENDQPSIEWKPQ